MKILFINSGNIGSTGNIMLDIATLAKERGHETMVACPKARDNMKKEIDNQVFIGNRLSRNLHLVLGQILGVQGCISILSTISFLKKVNSFAPDLIHLHNLHPSYINLPLLFRYIKKKNIKVVWTLHDCWAFTGHCPHFTYENCKKWKHQCFKCPRYKEYPMSYIDNSYWQYKLKKRLFTNIESMVIVTPSEWLNNLVKQSFLQEYSVKTIYNGIDFSVYRPTDSDFRKKYNIPNYKKIILGVAFGWGERKGLDVFLELCARLDYNKYQIVLVGTDDRVNEVLPLNIISIKRTQNPKELTEIYTAADIFINPTREEVLGLVNIEANACGTPVVTFETGGSPECISSKTGVIVKCDDINHLIEEIDFISKKEPFQKVDCIENAKRFDKDLCYERYLELFEEIVHR